MIKYEQKRTKERRKFIHLKIHLWLFTFEMFKMRQNLDITFNFRTGWNDRRVK